MGKNEGRYLSVSRVDTSRAIMICELVVSGNLTSSIIQSLLYKFCNIEPKDDLLRNSNALRIFALDEAQFY